jgi:hypothetical protein
VGNKKSAEELRQKLVGQSILVAYKLTKPDITFLVDRELMGKRVMQGPSGTYH